MSLVRLIVATRSSGPPASGKIIKEMPGSVASGTSYIYIYNNNNIPPIMIINRIYGHEKQNLLSL